MAIGTGAAILGAAGLGAGASILGSNRASNAISSASGASTAELRRQFDIATGLTRPSIEAGDTARNQLLRLLGLSVPGAQPTPSPSDFSDLPESIRNRFGLDSNFSSTQPTASADPLDVIRNTPGFQFQTEQGTRALNADRSAGGTSGGALVRDFTRFNQGVASSFYQDYANRLQDIAVGGNNTALATGSQAIRTGESIGRNITNAGNARASGIVGTTNSFTQLLRELAAGFGEGGFASDPPIGANG